MEKVLFKEEQRMHHPRLIVIVPILFFAIVIYIIGWLIRLTYRGSAISIEEITSNEFLFFGMMISLVLVLLLAYVHSCKLKTKISNKGIWLSYPPFKKKWKIINVDQIKAYQVRKYNPYREYYGHGFRNHWIHGKAYTISGNVGLQVYFKNGKKLLIGTQNKQAIEYAMEKLMKSE